jgi:hypothetical protein
MTEISARSMRRYNQRRKTVESITGDIAYWIGKMAHEMAYTAERITQYRLDIFNRVGYDKITERDRGEIDGVYKYVHGQHEQKLFWTHILDGQRVITGDEKLDGRHHELDTSTSYHCYLFGLTRPGAERVLIFVPFRQADRDQEIASGRLSEQDVSDVINGRRNGNQVDLIVPGHLLNGAVCRYVVHPRKDMIQV